MLSIVCPRFVQMTFLLVGSLHKREWFTLYLNGVYTVYDIKFRIFQMINLSIPV